MPWPQRSLKPKRSEFEIKMYLDVVFAKKETLFGKTVFFKNCPCKPGALGMNMQHLTNLEIAENGEIEAIMRILTGWCNLQLWGGIWWNVGLPNHCRPPPHTLHHWEGRTTGTQLHQRSPYKCSSTLHCITQSWSPQCIAFHRQIKVIIQFPSITPM